MDFSPAKRSTTSPPFVAVYRARGLAWIKVREDGWQSPIAKFFTDEEKQAMIDRIDMAVGDLVFFVADQPKSHQRSTGTPEGPPWANGWVLSMRSSSNFVWVTHFPMMEYDEAGETIPGPAPSLHRTHWRTDYEQSGLRSAGGAVPRIRHGAERLMKSAAAASVSTTWNYSSASSRRWGWNRPSIGRSSVSCWTPWNPVLRPTGALPSASTAW
jgi:hypothetical protein